MAYLKPNVGDLPVKRNHGEGLSAGGPIGYAPPGKIDRFGEIQELKI